MSISPADLTHILTALATLLAAGHGVGFLFMRFRQPRVIGEIFGGLLLGPTFLKSIAPEVWESLFPSWGPTRTVLAAIYQLGLLLLMFCSGAEIRAAAVSGERRVVLAVTLAGTFIPFVAGASALSVVDTAPAMGTNSTPLAFGLVFAIAIAVTSIPVISRIMLDLGILETSFARIVLGAAVIEDILLYIALAIALGITTPISAVFGLEGWLALPDEMAWRIAYHVVSTFGFFGASLFFGPRAYRWLQSRRWNLLQRSSPIAFQLVFLLILTGFCVTLGVAPMLGAFVAGMIAGSSSEDVSASRGAIKNFSFAFFVPLYFTIVGWRLDLVKSFDPVFFAGFLGFACAAKSLSVFAGARLVGETRQGSMNIAIAMNARGGPGIVLASEAFDRAVISESFYVTLVLVAIVTSLLAGSWLERVVRSGRELR